MAKRHLTPKEIIAQCKAVARESRMAERTPWTVMGILCAYVIMKVEEFKGKRILRVTNKINELEEQWSQGKIDLKEISQQLYEKADWTVETKPYTETDITAKKGSCQYWLDSKQIAPQNAINEQATRYMLFFFTALMQEYGFGRERLTRISKYMDNLLPEYQKDKSVISKWQLDLLEEAGVVIEMPIDPLTQTKGSLMTG